MCVFSQITNSINVGDSFRKKRSTLIVKYVDKNLIEVESKVDRKNQKKISANEFNKIYSVLQNGDISGTEYNKTSQRSPCNFYSVCAILEKFDYVKYNNNSKTYKLVKKII
jgi:hypothetical protein